MKEKKILVKVNDRIIAYGPKAAKIAIEHLGGVEMIAPGAPFELRSRIVPPEITKPIPLKQPEPVIIKKPEVNTQTIIHDVIHDSGQAKILPKLDKIPTIKPEQIKEPVKKGRKPVKK